MSDVRIPGCPDGLQIPDEMWAELEAAYGTPPRHYHTFDHVAEVARWYQLVATQAGWEHPHEVFLAVLYHDAIYEYGARDNEARSAELAAAAVDRWFTGRVDRDMVVRLIELTAAHGSLDRGSLTADEARFLDCDMAILGADPDQFAAYDRDIEAEYTNVYTPDAYRAGRRQFLEKVLAAPRIYHSDFFHARLDSRARDNLRRALGEPV